MTQTFTQDVLIDGSVAAQAQLRVQGAAGQTEALQTWEADAGVPTNPLARVTKEGTFQIGTVDATSDSLIEVRVDTTVDASKPKRGLHVFGKIANAVSDAINWSMHELELIGTAGVTTLQAAIRSKITHNNSGASTTADVRAGDFEAINKQGTTASRVGRLVGIRGTANNDTTGYATKLVGVEATVINSATDAANNNITDAAAFEVAAPTIPTAGSIGTLYGLRIPDLTQGDANFAIQTSKGIVRLGDHEELAVLPTAPTGNPPAGMIKFYARDNAGTPTLYIKTATGGEAAVGSGGGGGGGAIDNSLFAARLTLTTGTPVTSADVTAATSIFLTPFRGNRITLYNGLVWVMYSLAEISASLSGLLANTNYDVFVYDNAGVLTLDLTAWTNATTRTIALVLQDGVFVKSGATTRRYVGTIRIGATAAQTEDSVLRRFIFNQYNRAPRKLRATETSDWTYATNAWRPAKNNTANRVELVIGDPGVLVGLDLTVRNTGSGGGGVHAIGYDTTTAQNTDLYHNISNDGHNSAHMQHYPAIGYHFYQWVENARGNTISNFGFFSDAYLAGIVGQVTL